MPELKVTRVIDDPNIPEVFIDSPGVIAWVADGILHYELYALRRDVPPGPDGETARAVLRARLALTIPAAVSLTDSSAHHLAEMEKAGVFKRTAVAQSSGAKH
jgi:hypothetical protein